MLRADLWGEGLRRGEPITLNDAKGRVIQMMADQHQHHCPFINRADERCSEHFHLDDLNHAFDFCFDRFKRCPVYKERLGEWRLSKRAGAGS
jgi:hypothetical protein